MANIEHLYKKHGRQVYRYCYGLLQDSKEAEDVASEVFVTALKKIDQTKEYDKHISWLLTIARNHIMNRWRKKKFVTESEHFGQDVDSGLDRLIVPDRLSPLEELEKKEIRKRLQQAMKQLSEVQREVIVLRHFEGMKLTEIAAFIDTKLVTVKYRYYEGLKNLRKELVSQEDERGEYLWGLYFFSLRDIYKCLEYQPAGTLQAKISSLIMGKSMSPIALFSSKAAMLAGMGVVVGLSVWLGGVFDQSSSSQSKEVVSSQQEYLDQSVAQEIVNSSGLEGSDLEEEWGKEDVELVAMDRAGELEIGFECNGFGYDILQEYFQLGWLVSQEVAQLTEDREGYEAAAIDSQTRDCMDGQVWYPVGYELDCWECSPTAPKYSLDVVGVKELVFTPEQTNLVGEEVFFVTSGARVSLQSFEEENLMIGAVYGYDVYEVSWQDEVVWFNFKYSKELDQAESLRVEVRQLVEGLIK